MPSVVVTGVKTNTAAFLKANQAARAKFMKDVQLAATRVSLLFLGRFKMKRTNKPREWKASFEYTRSQSGKLGRDWFVGPGNNQAVEQNGGVIFSMFSTTPYAPFMEARIHFFEEVASDFVPSFLRAINKCAKELR